MKNYLHDPATGQFPLRSITAVEVVPNIHDDCGLAVRATLDCGHRCILTGSAISDVDAERIPCQPCANGLEKES